MAITGKMTVDLYGNTHPFVQSMKAAANETKKSGDSIANSIEKINAKQMKNAVTSGLKAVGVIGAIETGQQIMLATIKGMKDGSVKGLGDFGKVAAKAVTSVIEGIPVLGTFMEIGTEIGKWIAGIDELEAATEKSKQNFSEMKTILDLLGKSADTALNAVNSSIVSNNQFGVDADEVKRLKVIADMKETDHAANRKFIEFSDRTNKEQFKNKIGGEGKILEGHQRTFAQITKMEAEQERKRKEAYDEMKRNDEERAAKQKDLDDKNKAGTDLVTAQNALNDLLDEQHKIGMSARDIELERLANMEGMGMEMLTQAMAAWDQLEAEKARVIAQKELDNAKEKSEKEELDRIKKIKDAEIEAKQNARDEAIKAYEDYQEAQDVFAKTAEELDKKAAGVSATTSVDTAIGSVKIAGASDFSVQKEIDIAQSTLKEAKNQSDYLKSIDESLHKLGGTT